MLGEYRAEGVVVVADPVRIDSTDISLRTRATSTGEQMRGELRTSGVRAAQRVSHPPVSSARADDRCSDRPGLAVFQESGVKGCMRAMRTATSSGSAGSRSL
ncbi:hypothetical protein GCM10010501_11500 [Streptomyces libani subsp. rufus]|nr:hypothetical protein GCM10010501_11500 [Streptomyces libani subsp. rufus]